MDDFKVSIRPSLAEKAGQLDRTVELHNSIRVAEGKSELSQEEFVSAVLAGLQKRPNWVRILLRSVALLMAVLFLAGCSILPLKPGNASITDGNKVIQVHQSQNPKDSTIQDYRRVTDSTGVTTEEVHTKIGAAQKDTAREVAAKLSSLKGIVWVGVLLFLFGAASAVYPPLKLLVGGSVTTSAVIAAAGLALIVLPTLIVGHELLILASAVGLAGWWFFAHRHGVLRGQVTELLKK